MDIVAAPSKEMIKDFVVEAEVGRGSMSTVYRVRRDNAAYALKILRHPDGDRSAQMGLHFRAEAAAMARVSHPGVVNVFEVGVHQSRPYLVMELIEGEGLDGVIQRERLNEARFLSVARSVASALGAVHRLGVVHRDIKPQNIMIAADGSVKLIDFGFALEAGSKNKEGAPITATLSYAAPEQLGLLKRPMDGRADLYALGVTLFECLTGTVPFADKSSTDFLSAVAAQEPPDVRSLAPEVRPALAAILQKLLAKDPDDRYQTAEGFVSDLDRLSALDQDIRAGAAVVLGVSDRVIPAGSDVPLIGRSDKLRALERAWAKARDGQGAMVQVEGASGLGKTRVVREFLSGCTEEAVTLLRAKCQENEAAPFAAIREACDEYISHVLLMPRADRQKEIDAITEAAGDSAPWLRRLSAGFREILPEAPEPRMPDVAAERQRFYRAIIGFLCSTARRTGALILVVDDIQWLDDGSSDILRMIAERLSKEPLLVLTTARNDPDSREATERFVESVQAAPAERLPLEPLSRDDVATLVRAHLGGAPVSGTIVERLAGLAQGNPFVVGEYVRALLDQAALVPTAGEWRLAEGVGLNDVVLPRNALDLVVGRLGRLGSEAAHFIGVAAISGAVFDLETVAKASGWTVEQAGRGVQEALRANLIERAERGRYAFIHDRVQEAARGHFDEAALKDVHHALAVALDESEVQSTESMYALAKHYLQGHPERAPKRVYETALKAGMHALENAAVEMAHGFLICALERAPEQELKDDEWASLYGALGRVCNQTGRLQDAFRHLEKALELASNPEDRFRLQVQLALTHGSYGSINAGREKLYDAFDSLGRPFPRNVIVGLLYLHVYWALALFLRWTGIGYGSARGKDREMRNTLAELYFIGTMLNMFTATPHLVLHFAVRGLLNGHFLGASSQAAGAFSFYGAIMGSLMLGKTMKRYTELGSEIAEQVGDPAAIAQCKFLRGLGLAFSGSFREGNEYWTAAGAECGEHLAGSWWAGICMPSNIKAKLFPGWYRDSAAWALETRQYVEETNNLGLIANFYYYGALAHSATGNRTEAAEYLVLARKIYGVVELPPFLRMGKLFYHLGDAFHRGDVGEDFEENYEEALRTSPPYDYFFASCLMFGAYGRLLKLMQAPPEQRAAERRRFKRGLLRFRLNALLPLYKANAYVLRAALAREDGKHARAGRLLDKAWRMAADPENPNTFVQYYCMVEQARLARAAGLGSWRGHAIVALGMAQAEGYVSQAEQVRKEFDLEAMETDGVAAHDRRSSASSYSSLMRRSSSSMARSSSSIVRKSSEVSGLRSSGIGEALLQVSLASASSLNASEQARAALKEITRLLGGERALLFLVDEKTGELQPSAGYGIEQDEQHAVEQYSSTVISRVWETGEPLVVTNTESGELAGAASAVAYGLRSIIAAPLFVRENKLGVVYVDNRLAKGVFSEDDLGVLRALSSHIGVALEMARMGRLEAEQIALEKDIELSAAVQGHLLPRKARDQIGSVVFESFYRAATQCGGDWWWWEQDEEAQKLRFYVGDVTGHGAGAAMATAVVAGTFQTVRALRPDADVGELLGELHRALLSLRSHGMTMMALELDLRTKRVEMWSAGAPAVLHLRRGEGTTGFGKPSTPLGQVDELHLGHMTIDLRPGDRLLVCTDGVLEVSSGRGRDLGVSGVRRVLEQTREETAAVCAERLQAKVDTLTEEGRTQEDDITFLVLDVLDPSTEA